MKNFKQDEIIFLLGAGSSCDAGIKNSTQIILDIENQLKEGDWKKYSEIFNYIKSVFYQKQIHQGINVKEVNFNIENLVNLLDTIISIAKRQLEIYPFVGSWEKDLQPFISKEKNDGLATSFREQIIKSLRSDWLMPNNWIENSIYYKELIHFKKEYDGSPLKIFSLNYDRCVEHNLRNEKVESGFDENDKWDYKRYDYENIENDYFLYKLHGSIDWKKRNEELLIRYNGEIGSDDLAIIFGTSNKLQSYDPYLFYFYEFRIHCIKAKLVICSGYGFLDSHINDLLRHGFSDDESKRLIVNMYESDSDNVPDSDKNKEKEKELQDSIMSKLSIKNASQIILFNKKAKDFYTEDLKLENFRSYFSEESEDLQQEF